MAYTKHNWQTQEPITQAKMQNIEDGIENAHSGLDSRYTKTEINTMVSNINSNVNTAQTTANNALTIAQNVQLNTSGDQALGQIQDATINHEPKFNTLDLRLASIDANVGDAVSYATTSRDELNNAHLGFNSLRDKLNDMDDKTREQTQRITNIKEEVENARRGKSMLVDKITEIDTNISDDKTDIANIKAIIGYPVAANPEKTIQDIIGETNQALTNGIIEAKNYADTQLSNAKVDEIIAAHDGLEDTLSARFGRIETDVNSLEEDVEGINNNVTTLSSTMNGRLDDIEDAVEVLQSKSSTTVISEEAFATLQENIESGEEDPNPYIDYIVGPDTNGKYYYWKWINDSDEDKWKLISGGGGSGTGTSSALVFESLAAFEAATINNKDENTDYYVKDVNNYYTHYRFEKNNDVYTRIEIKQDAYTTTQTYSKTEVYNKAETDATIATAIENIDKDEYSLTYGTTPYGQDQIETENVLTLYRRESGATEGTPVSQVIIAGGGGGTGPVGTIITLNRITQSPVVITPTDNAIISVEYSCVDDQVEITGYYTWSKGTQTLMSGTLTQGLNTFDLTPYCTVGSQRLKLTVTNENGTQAPPKYWDVQMIDVRIESAFNDKYAYNGTDYVNFTYTPYGAVNKTVHIKLDGREVASIPTTSSGTLMSYSIAPQTHGAHLLEAYITAVVNNKSIETSHIYKDIIWAHSGNRTPIIGCIYRYDYYGEIFTKQYNSFTIPYYVYDPRSTAPTVILSENGNTVNTIKVSSASNVWAYKSNTVTWTEEDEGTPNTLTISCGTTNVEIKANITELGYTIEPITTNLAFDFNPSGYSNGDILHRLWNYTANNKTTSLTVSNNFDWSNGGYQLDSEGNTYFCVKSGTRAYIDYKLFETDPRNSGAEFKIIFKTTNVENVNASFLRCLTNNETDKVGLEMRTHEAYFSTETNTLEIPYSEEDIIEFEYNINPVDMENASATSYIMTYEDGVGARPLIYEQSTRLNQFSPAANIEIGSDNCDVWIYRMKAYTSALTDVDILKNFYADARNSDEMIARYERNQIYDENGRLTPESVAAACPDLKVIKIEAPYFTNDKKDYVKGTKVECIHTNGRPRDNWTWENGYHVGQGTSSNRYGAAGRNIDIIFGFDGEHTVVSKIKENDVQGYISKVTFSDGTVLSGADAKINLSETSVENSWFNIKVNIASSENANNALLQKRYNEYLPYLTPARKRDSRVKNSMEFYNCVIFIKETDETQNTEGIYTAHREFPRDTDWHFYGIGNIGDSKKTDNTRVNNPNDIKEFCVEVSDNNLPNSMFQTGVYRLDNGSYTFTPPINDSEQMERMVYPITEAQWEDERNLARKALSLEGYVSGQKLNEDTGEMEDVITNWDSSFEFRYDMGTKDGESFPGLEEQQELSKLKWNEMYKWVITCPDNKFAEELGNWFIVDSPLYWYLFTERYIMIDNRAKNSFYHYGKIYITEEEAAEMGDDARNYTIDNAAAAINEGYRFELWNYDDDTALGIDNSGLLKIPYGKEDIDKDELGAYIYNAAENIFWRRIRTLMNRQLTTLYSNTNLTSCWSANNLINEFDRWQNQFPEELWRLDIERKYIRPYQTGSWVQKDRVYSRDRTFLEGMANGRKKYQRRQFERDQEVYIATKYLQSAIFADSVEMRLATADPESAAVVPINDTIKITPYSDMYIRVMFGNTDVVSRRAKAGIEYEISPPFTITSRNTLQITVYAASRIQAFSDLSAFYIRDNNFSRATKLKTLVLGNSTPGYKNTALTSVGIGDNTLLETLDLRNLPNLTGTLNLTNCKNLKNLYASNTNLTAVNFANGGKITNAILPNTLNSLIFRNLNLLTNLNIAGYNNLTTFVCENSNVVNPLNIVQAAISTLQSITVTDLIWTLNNITILNNIYSKSTSLLSGLATITGGIKREEIIKYNEKWPDLELNLSNANITEQWEITFTYTDIAGNSHTYKEYVEDGEVAPDPMYLGLLDPVPGKPSETEVDYIFGNWIRNSNTGEMEYQEFSGWRRREGGNMSAVGASGNTEYVGIYTTTPRKYAVEWYADNVKVDETSVEYATQAVTTVIPNNKWDSQTQTAQIFAGWDKSTGQVKENMAGENRVNAVWLTGSVPTAEELAENGLNGLNEAQIYALSKTNSITRFNLLEDYIRDYKEIRLGNDYNYTNVESVVLVEDDETLGYNSSSSTMQTDERTIKIFDGQPHYNQTLPNVRPLSYENGFTLALDFKVHQSAEDNQNYILTCFQSTDDVDKGFKIVASSNGNITLTWGASNNSNNIRQIGVQGRRNIIVIRKPRNDNNLYVYYDVNSTTINGVLTANITSFTLNGAGGYTEMPIIFGSTGILNVNDNSVTLPTEKRIAKSIIYWSKLWKEDLGEEVCKEIALLCREKIQFQLEGFNDLGIEGHDPIHKIYSNDEATDRGVNLSFIAGSLLTTYRYSLITNSGADPGWAQNQLRDICNNRLFKSFPITWRSIIADTPTRTYGRELQDSTYNTYGPTSRITVYDKIYIPAVREINSSYSSSPFNNEGVLRTIPWHTVTKAYGTSGNYNIDQSRVSVRFINKSISPNANIFYYPSTTNPYHNSMSISGIELKPGDLWVLTDYNNQVLMYISQEDINKYKFNEANSEGSGGLRGLTPDETYSYCDGNGAWLQGNITGYFTRTIYTSSSSSYYGYYYVTTSGSISYSGTNNRRLLLGFSV